MKNKGMISIKEALEEFLKEKKWDKKIRGYKHLQSRATGRSLYPLIPTLSYIKRKRLFVKRGM